MTINNDDFPEFDHELLKPLHGLDDLELWQLWQTNPHQARYLIIIFYRYANLTEIIEDGINKIEIKKDYFERLWFYIIDQLWYYHIQENTILSEVIISLIKNFFTEEKLIVSQIYGDDFNLQLRYFPLKYYLQKSLDKLSPLERIIIVTKDKFTWEDEKLLNYLQQYEKNITLAEIKAYYLQSHSRLLNNLPTDIISIYL